MLHTSQITSEVGLLEAIAADDALPHAAAPTKGTERSPMNRHISDNSLLVSVLKLFDL